MNKKIIDPVDTALIEAELTPQRFLRKTNKADNDIYIVDAHTCPNTMREIGRLREIAFRSAGGGTGKECDIDQYDTMQPPCRQLIVWEPESRLILGGYRFIIGEDIRMDANGRPRIATSHMFDFSDKFIRDYLPQTLELGRSFVRLEYQSSRAGAKALYALDNLWDGLGALTVVYPQIRYLFGKVTMYPSYSCECRNMILYFMNKYFPDPDHLVRPRNPLDTHIDTEAMQRLFTGADFKADYRILNTEIRRRWSTPTCPSRPPCACSAPPSTTNSATSKNPAYSSPSARYSRKRKPDTSPHSTPEPRPRRHPTPLSP